MRTLTLVGVVLCITASAASAQQPVQLPKDGSGMLEFCNHFINALDSPSSELGPAGQGAAVGAPGPTSGLFCP